MEGVRTQLSVNINKVALIRNSRGENRPNLIDVARDCERYGADGITVHPRPDERHVRFDDLKPLKEANTTEFNIEGYPSDKFMEHMLTVKPHQCTLVPDAPDALTSNSGWNITAHRALLREVLDELRHAGIRSSLFLNPDVDMVSEAADIGADRVELYTGTYAQHYTTDRLSAVRSHVACAKRALDLNIGLNAGHDLDLSNLSWYRQHLPNLLEVSIGHALISDALYYGLENVIPMYKRKLNFVDA